MPSNSYNISDKNSKRNLDLQTSLNTKGMVFIKGGEFKGTCASQNPYLNTEGEECGYCGKTVSPGSDCKKD